MNFCRYLNENKSPILRGPVPHLLLCNTERKRKERKLKEEKPGKNNHKEKVLKHHSLAAIYKVTD